MCGYVHMKVGALTGQRYPTSWDWSCMIGGCELSDVDAGNQT